jgi:hypothetical protein
MRQPRLTAYSNFLLCLEELTSTLGTDETFPDTNTREKLSRLVDQAVGEIQVAYFPIYRIGSRKMRSLAGNAWQAAWDLRGWFIPADPSTERTIEQLGPLISHLKMASSKFAEAVQKAGGAVPKEVE